MTRNLKSHELIQDERARDGMLPVPDELVLVPQELLDRLPKLLSHAFNEPDPIIHAHLIVDKNIHLYIYESDSLGRELAAFRWDGKTLTQGVIDISNTQLEACWYEEDGIENCPRRQLDWKPQRMNEVRKSLGI